MTPAADPRLPPSCVSCGAAVEVCAFCDNDACPHPMCYRCVRLAVREEVAQPHQHGG